MSKPLKIFRVWQDDVTGWETIDAWVVVAEDEEDVRTMAPGLHYIDKRGLRCTYHAACADDGSAVGRSDSWHVEHVGTATLDQTRGVLVRSYNSG